MRTNPKAALAIALFFLFPVRAATPADPAAAGEETAGERTPAVRLHHRLKRDPLVVIARSVGDAAGQLDRFLASIERFAPAGEKDRVAEALRKMEEDLGFSLRDDLLALVGPDVAFVADLPPLDMAFLAMSDPNPETAAFVLGEVGVLAQVRDAGRVDESLRLFFTAAGGEASLIDGGVMRVRLKLPGMGIPAGPGAPSRLSEIFVFYASRDGLLALGFSKRWVESALAERMDGTTLPDGSDFAAVFSGLDTDPSALAYVNLPRIRRLVEESQFLRGMAGMNERGRAFLDEMLTPDMTGVGTGWTMVESSRGVRTVAYGPPGLSTGMLSTGVLAALTVPNLLEAVDRAKQKRTTADMRSIGIAVESFALDENRYPGPTDGWQPVDTIAALLEPAYIRELPREDGWGRALLFRSDGTSYRILSAGRDGELDRDWSGDIEPAVTTGADADIVWVDGLFVIRPARLADKLP